MPRFALSSSGYSDIHHPNLRRGQVISLKDCLILSKIPQKLFHHTTIKNF